MNIQTAIKDKDPHEYEDGYILAGDGLYEKRTNGWISHLTRIEHISELPDMEEKTFLKIKLPKMPFGIILDAWDFFREVSKTHKGEAIVLLTYNEKEFGLIAPKQEVSGCSLKYDTKDCINVIGTIHSHNTMSAFHSGTDDKDEEKMDGIHITLGNVTESFPSISCSATKNGERFMCRVDNLFEFADTKRTLDINKSMENVNERKYDKPDTVVATGQTSFKDYDKYPGWTGGDRFTDWYMERGY